MFPIPFRFSGKNPQEHIITSPCSDEKSRLCTRQRSCWVMDTVEESRTLAVDRLGVEVDKERKPQSIPTSSGELSEGKAAFPSTSEKKDGARVGLLPQHQWGRKETATYCPMPEVACVSPFSSFSNSDDGARFPTHRDDIKGVLVKRGEEEGEGNENRNKNTTDFSKCFGPSVNVGKTSRLEVGHSLPPAEDGVHAVPLPRLPSSSRKGYELIHANPCTTPLTESARHAETKHGSSPMPPSSGLYAEVRQYLLNSANRWNSIASSVPKSEEANCNGRKSTSRAEKNCLAAQILTQWRAQAQHRLKGCVEKHGSWGGSFRAHYRSPHVPAEAFLFPPFHFSVTLSVMDVLVQFPALGAALLAMGVVSACGPYQALLPGRAGMTIRTGSDEIQPFRTGMEGIWGRAIDQWLADVAMDYVRSVLHGSETMQRALPTSNSVSGLFALDDEGEPCEGLTFRNENAGEVPPPVGKGAELLQSIHYERKNASRVSWMNEFFSFIPDVCALQEWAEKVVEGNSIHLHTAWRGRKEGECRAGDHCVCHLGLIDFPSPLTGGLTGGPRVRSSLAVRRGGTVLSPPFFYPLDFFYSPYVFASSLLPTSSDGKRWVGVVKSIFFSSRQSCTPLHWAVVRLVFPSPFSDTPESGPEPRWSSDLSAVEALPPAGGGGRYSSSLRLPEVVLIRLDIWPTSREARGWMCYGHGKQVKRDFAPGTSLDVMGSSSSLHTSSSFLSEEDSRRRDEEISSLLQVGQVLELQGTWCILSPPPVIPYSLPHEQMRCTTTRGPFFPPRHFTHHSGMNSSNTYAPAAATFPSSSSPRWNVSGSSPTPLTSFSPLPLDPLAHRGGGEGCFLNVRVCCKAPGRLSCSTQRCGWEPQRLPDPQSSPPPPPPPQKDKIKVGEEEEGKVRGKEGRRRPLVSKNSTATTSSPCPTSLPFMAGRVDCAREFFPSLVDPSSSFAADDPLMRFLGEEERGDPLIMMSGAYPPVETSSLFFRQSPSPPGIFPFQDGMKESPPFLFPPADTRLSHIHAEGSKKRKDMLFPVRKGAGENSPFSKGVEGGLEEGKEKEENEEIAMTKFAVSCWMGFRLVSTAIMEPCLYELDGCQGPQKTGTNFHHHGKRKTQEGNKGTGPEVISGICAPGKGQGEEEKCPPWWECSSSGEEALRKDFLTGAETPLPSIANPPLSSPFLLCRSLSLGYFVSVDATISLWMASLCSCVRRGGGGGDRDPWLFSGTGKGIEKEPNGDHSHGLPWKDRMQHFHTNPHTTSTSSDDDKFIMPVMERGSSPSFTSALPPSSPPFSVLLVDEVPQGESWIRKSITEFTAAMGVELFTLITPTQVQNWQEKEYIPSYEVRLKPTLVVPSCRTASGGGPSTAIRPASTSGGVVVAGKEGGHRDRNHCFGGSSQSSWDGCGGSEKGGACSAFSASATVMRDVSMTTYMEKISAGVLSEATPYTVVFSEVELAPQKVLRLLQSVCTTRALASSNILSTPAIPPPPSIADVRLFQGGEMHGTCGDSGSSSCTSSSGGGGVCVEEAASSFSGHCVRRDGGQDRTYHTSMSFIFGLRDGVQLARQPLLFGLASRVDVAVRPAVSEQWRRRYEHLFVHDKPQDGGGSLPSSSLEEYPSFCPYQQQLSQNYHVWQRVYREAIRVLTSGEGVEAAEKGWSEEGMESGVEKRGRGYGGGDRGNGLFMPVISEACGDLLQQYFLAAKVVFGDAIDTNIMEKLVRWTRMHALLRSAIWCAASSVAGTLYKHEGKRGGRERRGRGERVCCSPTSASRYTTYFIDALVGIGLCDNTLHFLTGKTVLGRCVLSLLEAHYGEVMDSEERTGGDSSDGASHSSTLTGEEDSREAFPPSNELWHRLVVRSHLPMMTLSRSSLEGLKTGRASSQKPPNSAFSANLSHHYDSLNSRHPRNDSQLHLSDAYVLWLVEELLHHFSSLIRGAKGGGGG